MSRTVGELYFALLKERCEQDGTGTDDDVLARMQLPVASVGVLVSIWPRGPWRRTWGAPG